MLNWETIWTTDLTGANYWMWNLNKLIGNAGVGNHRAEFCVFKRERGQSWTSTALRGRRKQSACCMKFSRDSTSGWFPPGGGGVSRLQANADYLSTDSFRLVFKTEGGKIGLGKSGEG